MSSPPHKFKAPIDLIGINPFVFLPENILTDLFKQAGKEKGPIPVKGTVNNNLYKQTLVKYRGYWRLYINTTMLKDSPNRIGEIIEVTISFDPVERTITPNPKFIKALEENSEAKTVFDGLSPSKKHEIIRYISFLKTEKSIDKNIDKAIDFLLGNGNFVGRDKP
ncbi:conserved hypothetical protein [Treponema primitia ZAS-2]|uniref:DUF1905 domain-containing protein n=1 Tax=Treponema primitia (strain ATCC BAA-887 / DSM 12427 / ZAS-2) TaxID=545694 RepID=F5YRB9_TREPZ|nr:YdeI/OmpD-associated family protein [Treponema primitia]AEF85573.1 conserved hypothetical protein [Treponema primitia ZAS-2]